jgi:hypothetical protein
MDDGSNHGRVTSCGGIYLPIRRNLLNWNRVRFVFLFFIPWRELDTARERMRDWLKK